MQLIIRSNDIITGSSNLEELHSVPNFPVYMGCVSGPQCDDLVADLSWNISRDSGVIQLSKLIPLDLLYQAQHAGSVGAIWTEHHRVFSRFLFKLKPSSVLEVGGAHGILSKEYRQYGKIPWTILEPNPAPVDGCEARFIKGFFDDKFICEETFDVIVHSHVFEHLYEPDRFMCQLSGFMDEGKHLVFSLPNMLAMLERKYTNCINFEHTTFLTETYVEFLLAKHGFRLLEKEYFMDDHSIFYAAVRDPSVKPMLLPSGLYEKNKKLYLEYVQYHTELVDYLNSKINASDHSVYLFGAHVFAQYLIASGLNTTSIVSLLDNDPAKQGKRLYGTNLAVHSPQILRDVVEPWVILKAGVYNEEIRQDILRNFNSGTSFL